MTHTYSVLKISLGAYNEIAEKLKVAGYADSVEDGIIDMHGLALQKNEEASNMN